jgi:Spy/CpxP family protein refolding chaperone
MKNRIKFGVLMLMAGVLMWSTTVPAMAKDDRPKERFENMVKELQLSPEQVEQFKKLRQENNFKEKRAANQKQMMELRKKIVDEYALQNFDKAKIETYKKQILDLMKQGIEDHTARLEKMRGILTPEQFKKFQELKEKQFKKGMRPDRELEQ